MASIYPVVGSRALQRFDHWADCSKTTSEVLELARCFLQARSMAILGE